MYRPARVSHQFSLRPPRWLLASSNQMVTGARQVSAEEGLSRCTIRWRESVGPKAEAHTLQLKVSV